MPPTPHGQPTAPPSGINAAVKDLTLGRSSRCLSTDVRQLPGYPWGAPSKDQAIKSPPTTAKERTRRTPVSISTHRGPTPAQAGTLMRPTGLVRYETPKWRARMTTFDYQDYVQKLDSIATGVTNMPASQFFMCGMCPAMFLAPLQRLIHVGRMHPLRCDLCLQGYGSVNTWRQHRRIAHDDGNAEFACPETKCQHRTPNLDYLTAHMVKDHPGGDPRLPQENYKE